MEKWLIGVISDTHGLLRPEAYAALEGSDLIIHAGDVGTPEVLEELKSIAPVVAVRGNVDRGSWANALPITKVIEIGEVLIYLLHNIDELDIVPEAAGLHLIINGHSHRPKHTAQNGVHYLNPGSAGPRRFDLPVTVARMEIYGKEIDVEIIDLL